jgi:hypothetical protein
MVVVLGGGRRARARDLARGKGREFYVDATRGRSASHHLEVKAAFSLLYKVLSQQNRTSTKPPTIEKL